MDAKKLGIFIAKMRKEKNMTQADLAKKLQITGKAVNKWERGLGFPDITMIEVLADALGVSILEIMKSEKIDEKTINQQEAPIVLSDILDLAKQQKLAMLKSVLGTLGITGIIIIIFGIYLKIKPYIAISLIGADGPTSIFIAGKINTPIFLLILGIVVLLLAVLLYVRKKKQLM